MSTACMPLAAARPSTPPMATAATTRPETPPAPPRRKPSARSVPISPTRCATAANMVIIAPTDRADREDHRQAQPQDADEGGQRLALLGIEADLGLGLQLQARVGVDARPSRCRTGLALGQAEDDVEYTGRRKAAIICSASPQISLSKAAASESSGPPPPSRAGQSAVSRPGPRHESRWPPSARRRSREVPGRNMRPSITRTCGRSCSRSPRCRAPSRCWACRCCAWAG
jgi:hypothetical protein